MTARQESGVGDSDPHQRVVDYIVRMGNTAALYRSYTFMDNSGFASEFLDRMNDDFVTELSLGIHAVNHILGDHGGTPVDFVDENDGEQVSGKIVAFKGFDARERTWDVTVIRNIGGLAGEFKFSSDEVRNSYTRTLDKNLE